MIKAFFVFLTLILYLAFRVYTPGKERALQQIQLRKASITAVCQ